MLCEASFLRVKTCVAHTLMSADGTLHEYISVESHSLRCGLELLLCVRFTYNEASNVIMTVTESASHMRGSEFCQRKQLCPGYRPMGLSRNSACLKIKNGQKQRKLSESSMDS